MTNVTSNYSKIELERLYDIAQAMSQTERELFIKAWNFDPDEDRRYYWKEIPGCHE